MASWPFAVHQSEERDMTGTNKTTNSRDQRDPDHNSRCCETLGLTSIGRMVDPRLCLLMSSIAGVVVTVGLNG